MTSAIAYSLPGVDRGAFLGGVIEGPANYPAGMRSDSLFFPQELTYVTGRSRELYRPLHWRQIVRVEPFPTWAMVIEDRKIQTLAQDPVNISNKSPTNELPMPALSVANQFIRPFEFGLAYGYTDQDIEYASHVGLSLPEENIQGCNMAFEQFLEKVASVGETATGMKGLYTLSDLQTVTATTKAATGTTWCDTNGVPNATAAEMVKDLSLLVNSVYVNTKENYRCTDIVLPILQWQTLNQVFTSALETTAAALFSRINPGVNIHVWDKGKNQGAGNTPCAMAWSSQDPNAPSMLVAREATYGQPQRQINGWVVPGRIKIAGVRCKNPTGVSKMSGL